MDQAASDYVLAARVLHAGSIVMTHAVVATVVVLINKAGLMSPALMEGASANEAHNFGVYGSDGHGPNDGGHGSSGVRRRRRR